MLLPEPDSLHRRRPAPTRLVAACFIAGPVLAAHAGLIGRSRWQADEYQHLGMVRDGGLHYALASFLHWSARPWSDAVLTYYGFLVNRLHRPLSGSFILFSWAWLACACLAPA